MNKNPLRVAIVGYGVVGPLHALAYRIIPTVFPFLNRFATLALIIDPSESARTRGSLEQGVPVVPNLEHLEAYKIDMIDCCCSTHNHAEVCEKALGKGLAVLCEKPLTGDVSSSRRLLSMASASKAYFGMNFNFRFVPAIQEAKRRISSGLLGQLKSFRVEYHRSSNIGRWKKGGRGNHSFQKGALMDLGPHAIDMVHFLFGPISNLSASIQHYASGTDSTFPDDIAKLYLTLDNQAQGYVEVSKVTPGAANDLRIFAYGTDGAIQFSMDNPNIVEIFSGGEKWQVHERTRIIASGGEFELRVIPPETPSSVLHWHSASIASFIKAITEGTSPSPSIYDGLSVDLVLETALTSISKGSAKVLV